MYNEKINFINNPASVTAKSGKKQGNALYIMTVYDDEAIMEGAEWIQTLHPFEGSSIDKLVENIIADMEFNGLTAVFEKKAA